MEWIDNKLVFDHVDLEYLHYMQNKYQLSVLEQLKGYMFLHGQLEGMIEFIEIPELEEHADYRKMLIEAIKDYKKISTH